jgi:hypothetical protein
MHALNPFTRLPRFIEPWNKRIGWVGEKPVQKFRTAGAERVPPAPWVKIRVDVLVEEGEG